jgi:hypothetical protein
VCLIKLVGMLSGITDAAYRLGLSGFFEQSDPVLTFIRFCLEKTHKETNRCGGGHWRIFPKSQGMDSLARRAKGLAEDEQ